MRILIFESLLAGILCVDCVKVFIVEIDLACTDFDGGSIVQLKLNCKAHKNKWQVIMKNTAVI